jgi:hypothetical protein
LLGLFSLYRFEGKWRQLSLAVGSITYENDISESVMNSTSSIYIVHM